MLTDDWDISHICIAVDDLEAAMTMYSQAFGASKWGPLMEFSDDMDVASPLLGEQVSMVGLREIWSLCGSSVVTEQPPVAPPFAPLELAQAERFSPAFSIWGCRDGRHYVHHIAYWVDDLEAESEHLLENGFARELTIAPGDRARGFAYHLSPTGMRVEIQSRSDKAAHARWLTTGEIKLDWLPEGV
jgi:catechol 2,3-dioxygenase-like lactoylglutathione lyase family enzyme